MIQLCHVISYWTKHLYTHYTCPSIMLTLIYCTNCNNTNNDALERLTGDYKHEPFKLTDSLKVG